MLLGLQQLFKNHDVSEQVVADLTEDNKKFIMSCQEVGSSDLTVSMFARKPSGWCRGASSA